MRVLALLVSILALAAGPEARAEVLVSNLSGAQSLQFGLISTLVGGARFVTGAEATVLDAVTIRILEQSSSTGSLEVGIWSNGGDDLPATELLELAVPPVPVPDVYVDHLIPYAGPAFVLLPRTTYWVVVESTGNGRTWRGSNSAPSPGNMGPLSFARAPFGIWEVAPGAHRPMFEIEVLAVPPLAVSPDVSVLLGARTLHDGHAFPVADANPAPAFAAPAGAALAAFHRQPGGDVLYVLETTADLGAGVTAEPRDVVIRSGGVDSIKLDGSAVGVPAGARIDALSMHFSGDLLISFDTTVDLDGVPGGAVAEDEDVVLVGSSLSLYFDGSLKGVDPALDLDGLHYDTDEDVLLLSFDGSGVLGSDPFDDEDVLRFEAGSWQLAVDASLAHPELAAADVTAVPEPAMGWGLVVSLTVVRRLGSRKRRDSQAVPRFVRAPRL